MNFGATYLALYISNLGGIYLNFGDIYLKRGDTVFSNGEGGGGGGSPRTSGRFRHRCPREKKIPPTSTKGSFFSLTQKETKARVETGGADQWVLKRRELSGFARVNKVTSASLGYPLSVFKKNSTLKKPCPLTNQKPCTWRASCVRQNMKNIYLGV